MTRYAIGDIHGGSETFMAMIQQINPKHDDRVYLLGDFIDRGPDSKGVLDAIIAMQEAGCDIRPLRGNHEDMLIRNLTNDHDLYSCHWMAGWGAKTLFNFGIKQPEDLPLRYRKFLAGLPYFYEDGDFILVHGGIDLGLDDPLDTSAEQMLWESSYIPELLTPSFRRVICGHRVHALEEIQASLTQQIVNLDNGAFTNQKPERGNLIALNVDTMQLFTQPWLDRKAVW